MAKDLWVRERLIDGVYVDDYIEDFRYCPKGYEYDDVGDFEAAYSNWISGQFRDND